MRIFQDRFDGPVGDINQPLPGVIGLCWRCGRFDGAASYRRLPKDRRPGRSIPDRTGGSSRLGDALSEFPETKAITLTTGSFAILCSRRTSADDVSGLRFRRRRIEMGRRLIFCARKAQTVPTRLSTQDKLILPSDSRNRGSNRAGHVEPVPESEALSGDLSVWLAAFQRRERNRGWQLPPIAV